MRDYRRYTDEDVVKNASEVKSIAGLLRNLNLRVAGGNYATIKRSLQRLDVDCSHWTGQGWTRKKQLKDWSDYRLSKSLKPHLIKERGHKCEECHLEKWGKKPIPLELEHIDGDRTNNEKDNLKLLCCNCHALTPTWRGRACRKKKIKRFCKDCGTETKTSKSGFCSPCFNKTRDYRNVTRIVKNRPSKEQLSKEISESSYCAVGRKYGVTDNAIRKWLK